MSLPLIVRAEAEAELKDSYRWYENRREGLGLEFLGAIEAGLAAIRGTPEAFPRVHRELRRVLVKRFPFALYYVVEAGVISVVSVFHAKRDPRIWKRRV